MERLMKIACKVVRSKIISGDLRTPYFFRKIKE